MTGVGLNLGEVMEEKDIVVALAGFSGAIIASVVMTAGTLLVGWRQKRNESKSLSRALGAELKAMDL